MAACRKWDDFCKTCPRMYSRIFILFSLATGLGLFGACNRKQGVDQEYQQISEAASHLSRPRVYTLNSAQSEIVWEATGQNNRFLKGKFTPHIGSMVLENQLLVAGFWSGNLWQNQVFVERRNSIAENDWKALADSTPVLRSEAGKQMRFDISQVSRFVVRSDFRTGYQAGPDSAATHLLQGQLILADSTLPVQLPVKLTIGTKRIEIQGNYTLNYPDFGIGHQARMMEPKLIWNKSIPIKYRLVFDVTH